MLQTIIYLMSPLPISLDVSYSYDNNLFVLVSFPLFYRLFVEKEIVTSVEMQYSEKIPSNFSASFSAPETIFGRLIETILLRKRVQNKSLSGIGIKFL